jgi:hypothetical protein
VQDTSPVWRCSRLFEHHKELTDAAFARTIGPKKTVIGASLSGPVSFQPLKFFDLSEVIMVVSF